MAEEPRKIIIRGDEAFPPYEFINDKGEPDGFNIDLTRAVMKELGLPYDLQLEDWTEALRQFENGEVDLITGVAKLETPDKRFYLSKIAVTANAFDSDRVEAMKAGCDAFVTKPVKKKELEDMLRV